VTKCPGSVSVETAEEPHSPYQRPASCAKCDTQTVRRRPQPTQVLQGPGRGDLHRPQNADNALARHEWLFDHTHLSNCRTKPRMAAAVRLSSPP
jgi:hypothetical protein